MKTQYLLPLTLLALLPMNSSAQMISADQCFPMIQQAETNPDPQVYEQCGFNVLNTATTVWAPIAEQHKLAHALYEICTRHPTFPQSQHYCIEAAKLGDGPAVAWAGDLYYQNKQIPKAMSFYNYALQRGGLTSEREGQILANLAILQADPSTAYYNQQQSVPLLKRAAKQRSAIANNILGYLTFFGQYGIKANTKEAFAFFWRAILLGCPAAEENLGFLQLARQKDLDMKTVKDLMSSRVFSCEPSNEEQVVIPEPTGDLIVNVYRLSFTPEECADVNYYAERLVDSTLPFTGKKECGFSGDMTQMEMYLNTRDTLNAIDEAIGSPKHK